MSSRNTSPLLSKAQLESVALLFRLLGDPTRLRVLQAVCRGPLAVGDVVQAAAASQANVSKHLALLAAAGILARRRDGQRIFYSIKNPLALKLCALVHQHLDS